jgi:hypothetical protein
MRTVSSFDLKICGRNAALPVERRKQSAKTWPEVPRRSCLASACPRSAGHQPVPRLRRCRPRQLKCWERHLRASPIESKSALSSPRAQRRQRGFPGLTRRTHSLQRCTNNANTTDITTAPGSAELLRARLRSESLQTRTFVPARPTTRQSHRLLLQRTRPRELCILRTSLLTPPVRCAELQFLTIYVRVMAMLLIKVCRCNFQSLLSAHRRRRPSWVSTLRARPAPTPSTITPDSYTASPCSGRILSQAEPATLMNERAITVHL